MKPVVRKVNGPSTLQATCSPRDIPCRARASASPQRAPSAVRIHHHDTTDTATHNGRHVLAGWVTEARKYGKTEGGLVRAGVCCVGSAPAAHPSSFNTEDTEYTEAHGAISGGRVPAGHPLLEPGRGDMAGGLASDLFRSKGSRSGRPAGWGVGR
jgi:hypothetical protein